MAGNNRLELDEERTRMGPMERIERDVRRLNFDELDELGRRLNMTSARLATHLASCLAEPAGLTLAVIPSVTNPLVVEEGG